MFLLSVSSLKNVILIYYKGIWYFYIFSILKKVLTYTMK